MNKAILSLLLAVCILGMALIMLNDRLRRPEVAPQPADVTAPAVTDAPPADALPPEQPPQNMPRGETPPEALAPAPHPVAASKTPAAPLPEQQPVPAPTARSEVAQPDRQAVAPSTPRTAEQPKPHTPEQQAAKATKPEAQPTPTPPKPTAQPAPKPKTTQQAISRFVVFTRETGATVRLVGNVPLVYKSMQLTGPDRVVIDLDGQWQLKAPGVPKNPLVTNVRIGKADGKTRVVIDLGTKPKTTRYTLSKDHRMLDIRVDR